MSNTEAIRKLNDEFRKTFRGGRVLVTQGINALPSADVAEIMKMVSQFNTFEEGDDPYQEHDFGAFDYKGNRIFFKIDYYDTNYEYASEDPADPSKTNRILTVMLAEEY